MARLSPILKWIVFGLLGLAVLFILLRSGLRFLADFTDWARRLLEALRNFWANLFGGWRRTSEETEESEQEERTMPERPFASFANPLAGGKSGMAVPELVRYTFAAVQAWARERDLGRQPGETPLEFAERDRRGSARPGSGPAAIGRPLLTGRLRARRSAGQQRRGAAAILAAPGNCRRPTPVRVNGVTRDNLG